MIEPSQYLLAADIADAAFIHTAAPKGSFIMNNFDDVVLSSAYFRAPRATARPPTRPLLEAERIAKVPPRPAAPPSEARIEMATLKSAGEHNAQLATGGEIFRDRNADGPC